MSLTESIKEKISKIGTADIMVGIPSFKCADTIEYVVKQACKGMLDYYPSFKPIIVNSDGNSPDGTMAVVEKTQVPSRVEKIAFSYSGIPGKGSSLRAIFEVAKALKVKVCIILDSDLRNFKPLIIKNLANPIIEKNYDLVTPLYMRHKYDGTITNSMCYPLTSALYGKEIRQPIAGEMAFSNPLINKFLENEAVWETDVARFGIDIWMTTTALNGGFKIAEANMGTKIHDAKDPGLYLGPMFREVIGTLFSMMKLYEKNWKKVNSMVPVELLGEKIEYEIESIDVNIQNMLENFKKAFEKEKSTIKNIVKNDNFSELEKLSMTDDEKFDFPDELWIKIAYDYANSYCNSSMDKSKIINSFIPIYFGRTGSFVKKVEHLSTEEAEEQYIKKLKNLFLKMKSYLINSWGY